MISIANSKLRRLVIINIMKILSITVEKTSSKATLYVRIVSSSRMELSTEVQSLIALVIGFTDILTLEEGKCCACVLYI